MNPKYKYEPYPDALRRRAYELYYENNLTMPTVLQTVQMEFPEVGTRLNSDRLHSVVRQYRLKMGKPAKTKMQKRVAKHKKPAPKKSSNKIVLKDKESVLSAAEKLRDEGYKFKTISERLTAQFPGENIPQPHHLALLLRTRKQNGKAGYTLSLRGPSGAGLYMSLPEDKVTSIIRAILDI